MVICDDSLTLNPIVSVAIITYNHGCFLSQCIDHVLSQITDFDFEIVIADDYSLDGAREICKEYQKKYPNKIKLILQDTNVGLINNYCSLLDACRGEFIAQVSGDDYWCDDNKLKKQVESLQINQDCDLCYTNTYYCDKNGVLNGVGLEKSHIDVCFVRHLINAGYLAPNSWMFRRTVLSYLDMQSWFTDESLALALDVLAHSKFFYLDEVTSVYRVHNGSAAAQTQIEKKWKYHEGIFRMQLYYAEKYVRSEEVVQHIKMQGYVTNMLLSLEAKDSDFVSEALSYYRDNGMELKWFVESCKEYVRYKMQFDQIRRSNAYRLGKTLLKPFKWLRKK